MNSYSRHPNQVKLDIEREKLESLFDQSRALRYQQSRLLLGLKQIGSWLLKVLISGNEPRIWIHQSSTGKRWCAYDPITKHSVSLDSEAELRVWLEKRYYQ